MGKQCNTTDLKDDIIIFAVDIAYGKKIAWAVSKNERIIKVGAEDKIQDILQHVPPGCVEVVAERVYLGRNYATSMKLQGVLSLLEHLCSEEEITLKTIGGSEWQAPLKQSFGLKRQVGMTDHKWMRTRYIKYRAYLFGYLNNGLKSADLSDDMIAAACMALYASRKIKSARLYGLDDNGK